MQKQTPHFVAAGDRLCSVEQLKRQPTPPTSSAQTSETLSLPGEIIKETKKRKGGMQTACFQLRKKNPCVFYSRRRQQLCPHMHFEGHQLFQEGLSFRMMTLSSDRAAEGPVEMAEHTSECTPAPLQAAESELNPWISCPTGVTR